MNEDASRHAADPSREETEARSAAHAGEIRKIKLTVRKQLFLGFGTLIVLFTAALAFAFIAERNISRNIRDNVSLQYQNTEDIEDVLLGMQQSNARVRGYALFEDELFLARNQKSWDELIWPSLARIESRLSRWQSEGNAASYSQGKKILEQINAGNEEAVSLIKKGDLKSASFLLKEKIRPLFDETEQTFGKIEVSQREIFHKGVENVLTQAKNLEGLFYVLFPVILLVGGGTLYYVARALRQAISQVHEVSLRIQSNSNEILAASTQHESTANEQSTQMNQIQSTVNQFATTSTQLNQATQQVVKFSSEISNQADEGRKFIHETNSKLATMTQSNESVGAKLKVLNDKIEGIGQILAAILSVADQTNLLSLNAAIEAAKAGEHGKGFSVVAQAIGKLADQTARSSREIKDIVTEIQAASSSVIMMMDRSAQDVQESTASVSELSNRFSGIAERVQAVLPQIEGISQGLSEFSTGNRQISASVTQMNEALRTTVAAAKQLKHSAYDLTTMGHQLRGEIARF